MYNQDVDICTFAFSSILDQCKNQKMSDKVVSKEPSLLKNCIDRYKTEEMCDKSVDAFLPTLKFVPNSFFNNKMLEKLGDVVFSNDDIVLFIEDSNNAKFLVMIQALRLHMLIILTTYVNNINLYDGSFDDDDSQNIIHVRVMALCKSCKQRKACKNI